MTGRAVYLNRGVRHCPARGCFNRRTRVVRPTGSVAIDNDDIGGVVTGPSGPEAASG
jgi:hypothetical protein